MKKFLVLLLAVVMLFTLGAVTAFATETTEEGTTATEEKTVVPSGYIKVGYISSNYNNSGVGAIHGEATGVIANESFVVKLYCGETLVGTATLNDPGHVLLNGVSNTITWHAALTNDGDTWWTTKWEDEDGLKANAIPDKIEIWVDETKVSGCEVEMNGADFVNPVFGAITNKDGVIKSFVSAEGYANTATLPKYATALNEAVANAEADDTIVLTRDIVLDESVSVKNVNALSLDLNGYEVTANFGYDSFGAIYVGVNGNLTVKDSSEAQTGSITSTTNTIFGNYGMLTIEGGTYTGGELVVDDYTYTLGEVYNYYYNETTYGKATINGGKFNTSVANCGELDVNGGQFALIDNSGSVTIDNAQVYDLWARDGADAQGVTDAGSVVVEENATVESIWFANGEDVVFYNDPSTITPEGYATVKNSNGTYSFAIAVAKIGTTYYATLADAIAAAEDGDIVTLLSDLSDIGVINVGTGVTVDGNGHKITGNSKLVLSSDGAVTIQNIYFQNIFTGDESNKLSAITATMTDSSVITIDGCTFENIDWDSIQLSSSVVLNGAKIVITNNIFKDHTATDFAGKRHVHIEAKKLANQALDITMTANKFYGTIDGGISNLTLYYLDEEKSTLNVSGNYFASTYYMAFAFYDGTSSYAAPKDYLLPILDENLENELDLNAYFTYGNFNIGYTNDIQEAIDSTYDANDKVVLLDNVTLSEMIEIEKAITLDLNKYTITATSKKAIEVYANTTIKNGKIVAGQRCVDTRTAVELTLDSVELVAEELTYGNSQPLTIGGSDNGTKVTLNNVKMSSGSYGYCIISFVETELTATNCELVGYNALYVKDGSEGSVFNFVKCNLTGDVTNNDVAGNSMSVIAVQTDNVTINLDADSTITAKGNNSCAFSLGTTTDVAPIYVSDVKIESEATLVGNVLSTDCVEDNTVIVPADYADTLKSEGFVVKTNENGTVSPTEEAISLDEVFTYLGYSISEDGNGITVGYILDNELYNKYCEQNKVTPELGMAFGVDELSVYESYSSFGVAKRYNATINGLTEEHYEYNLVMAIYVSVGDKKRFVTGVNGEIAVVDDASLVESVTYKSLLEKGAN